MVFKSIHFKWFKADLALKSSVVQQIPTVWHSVRYKYSRILFLSKVIFLKHFSET